MNATLIKLVLSIAAAGLLVGGYFHYKNVRADRDRYKAERNEARAQLAEMIEGQKLSEEIGNDYETEIVALRTQLDHARRLRSNAKCQPVLASPSLGPDGRAAKGKLSGGNGLTTGYLIDFAGRCEEARLKTIGLQRFINGVYQLNE